MIFRIHDLGFLHRFGSFWRCATIFSAARGATDTMKHVTLVACAVAALSLLAAVTAEDDPNAAVPGVLDLGRPSAATARRVSYVSYKFYTKMHTLQTGNPTAFSVCVSAQRSFKGRLCAVGALMLRYRGFTAVAPPKSQFIVIGAADPDNFDQHVNGRKHVLLELYAPWWCVHSHRLHSSLMPKLCKHWRHAGDFCTQFCPASTRSHA